MQEKKIKSYRFFFPREYVAEDDQVPLPIISSDVREEDTLSSLMEHKAFCDAHNIEFIFVSCSDSMSPQAWNNLNAVMSGMGVELVDMKAFSPDKYKPYCKNKEALRDRCHEPFADHIDFAKLLILLAALEQSDAPAVMVSDLAMKIETLNLLQGDPLKRGESDVFDCPGAEDVFARLFNKNAATTAVPLAYSGTAHHENPTTQHPIENALLLAQNTDVMKKLLQLYCQVIYDHLYTLKAPR